MARRTIHAGVSPWALAVCVACVTMVTGNSSCAPRCSWVAWESWSDCSASCGGGFRVRTRGLCCRVDVPSFDVCVAECGVDRSDARQEEDCNEVCHNGGTFIQGSDYCGCPPAYYGSCCDNSKKL